MELDYNWDVYEEFREEIYVQLETMEENILNLHKSEYILESVNSLFRTFHSFKANTNYLALTSFLELTTKVENILSVLREDNEAVQDSIIEWLLQVKDQITNWHEDMQSNETNLEPASKELLNKVHTTNSYITPSQTLKTLTILYVDANKQRSNKMLNFLNKFSKNIVLASTLEDTQRYLALNKINILITNISTDNHTLIDFTKDNFTNLPVIPIFDSISRVESKNLLKKYISHAITNPINPNNLQRELLSIIKAFHSSKNIIIDHNKIINFIQMLQPLSNTISRIMNICDDDEAPIKELIKVVKTDPVISANILNIANSPLYGSTSVKTIDQAVAKFGKKVIKALAMSKLYTSLGKVDLNAYGINEDMFSKISMARLSLMLKWYAKISISDLSILSSTALLGNIGQLLISKELSKDNKVEKFQELCKSKGIDYAEESIMFTNTTTISSQILNYWKLSDDVVDIISFSNTPKKAPKELRKLSVANHIVYRLIDIQGNVATTIYDDLLPLMKEYDFDTQPLQKALDSISL